MGYQTMFDLDFSEAVSYEREKGLIYIDLACSINLQIKSTNRIYKSNLQIESTNRISVFSQKIQKKSLVHQMI